ncbi:hypothetical protein J8N05_47125 (plasmid) [Streptomyces sp. BH-SS-21]|uniref:Uncharacterized protein n=1 Tax=Streptomyces liliiviolaceus TaxID=2823109 RepID=A0A940YAQ9_9ACTN|nr:hypothetical protein [Streptomyces liliiviolaceus]MBQ0855735.1 hypothetical protein [Streptomyces liliiviolaceus]
MDPVLHTPARPYEPDSPLAYLMEIAAAAVDEEPEDEQRDGAETGAAHHVYAAYAYSLAQAVDSAVWQGYPCVREHGARRFEASAVALLGGGLWLHHTLRVTEADGAHDVLTLIAPCTCGRGYADITIDTEDVLMEILAELKPTYGRSLHDDQAPDCHSVQQAPAVAGWPRSARSIG